MVAVSTLRANKKARGANPMMMLPHMMPGMMNDMMPGLMGRMMMPPMTMPHHGAEESDEEEQAVPPLAKAAPAAVSGVGSSSVVSSSAAMSAVVENDPTATAALAAPQDSGLISRSVTYVRQLPRNRLGETLEALSGAVLDAAVTAELTQDGLLILLWLFCRIKPCVKISDLRFLAEWSSTLLSF